MNGDKKDGKNIKVTKSKGAVAGIVIGVAAAATVTGLLIATFSMNNSTTKDSSVPQIETNVNNGKTAKEIIEETNNVSLPGWVSFEIAAETTDVTVDFFNPEVNKDHYYLTFELLLKNGDGYESLYKSGLVEPGDHITNITLNRSLSAGEYEASVHIKPYTMTDPPEATDNDGKVNIKLIVN